MKVTVFGSGYVGLVTGACFAEAGNQVVCVDIDANKVARLQEGEIPIHEPGLDVMVKRNFEKGRLKFTTDAEEGIRHGLFQFIAVGTPPEEDGSADLSHVLAVAETIGWASAAPGSNSTWSRIPSSSRKAQRSTTS